MIRVRFHRSIYSATAVAGGVAVFADVARVRIDEGDTDYVQVELEASDGIDERALEGAFANYVLGASIDAAQQLG